MKSDNIYSSDNSNQQIDIISQQNIDRLASEDPASNITGKTVYAATTKNNKKRNLTIGVVVASIILLVSIIGYVFVWNAIQLDVNTKPYNDYLIKKYNFSKSDLKLLSYEKEHYESTGLSEGTMTYGKIYIPTVAIFKISSGKNITVVDDGKNISDNYQIRDISDIAAKYFSVLLKYDVKFVEFRGTYNGDAFDSELSDFIKNGNNYLVNDNNIEKFLVDLGNNPSSLGDLSSGSITSPSDSTLTLYVRLSKDDDINLVMNNINIDAMKFIDKVKLTKFGIWLYTDDENLSIINAKIESVTNQSKFENYYVINLNNIKLYMFYVDPNGNERDPNFDKKGNFYIDDSQMWFSKR